MRKLAVNVKMRFNTFNLNMHNVANSKTYIFQEFFLKKIDLRPKN